MIKKPKERNIPNTPESKGLPIRHSTIKEYVPIKRSSLPLTEKGMIYDTK